MRKFLSHQWKWMCNQLGQFLRCNKKNAHCVLLLYCVTNKQTKQNIQFQKEISHEHHWSLGPQHRLSVKWTVAKFGVEVFLGGVCRNYYSRQKWDDKSVQLNEAVNGWTGSGKIRRTGLRRGRTAEQTVIGQGARRRSAYHYNLVKSCLFLGRPLIGTELFINHRHTIASPKSIDGSLKSSSNDYYAGSFKMSNQWCC